MEKLHCLHCGAPLTKEWKKDEDGFYVCSHCRSVNDFGTGVRDRVPAETVRHLYALLENLDFASASEELAALRTTYPKSANVYFLSSLAEANVSYTRDSYDPTKCIPTFASLLFTPIKQTEFARKALTYAETPLVKETYEETYATLEAKRLEILAATQESGNDYDVFISTKVTAVDEDGNEIRDELGNPIRSSEYNRALEIYAYLREHYPALRVFFSESMEIKAEMAGNKYENVIYSALHSARAFLLIGNSRGNLEWRWVRNEWKRYLQLMADEPMGKNGKRHFLFITDRLTPSELPKELRPYEYVSFAEPVRATTKLEGFLHRCFEGPRETVPPLDATASYRMAQETVDRLKFALPRHASLSTIALLDEVDRDLGGLLTRLGETERVKFRKQNQDFFQAIDIDLPKEIIRSALAYTGKMNVDAKLKEPPYPDFDVLDFLDKAFAEGYRGIGKDEMQTLFGSQLREYRATQKNYRKTSALIAKLKGATEEQRIDILVEELATQASFDYRQALRTFDDRTEDILRLIDRFSSPTKALGRRESIQGLLPDVRKRLARHAGPGKAAKVAGTALSAFSIVLLLGSTLLSLITLIVAMASAGVGGTDQVIGPLIGIGFGIAGILISFFIHARVVFKTKRTHFGPTANIFRRVGLVAWILVSGLTLVVAFMTAGLNKTVNGVSPASVSIAAWLIVAFGVIPTWVIVIYTLKGGWEKKLRKQSAKTFE